MGRKSREKRERRVQAQQTARYQNLPIRYAVQPRPSSGTTDSERALARLARETFMSLWSYPNVVRDQPQSNGGVIAKEVADLLVVFEDDVILFSDKDCVFPNTGKLDLDWSRWYRRAVASSASQLWGAERWIRQHPQRVFIDQHCKIPLPVPLPDISRMRVHRVVVAHGACSPCRRHLGGSGSLMIVPSIWGEDHCKPRSEEGLAFAIGRVDPRKPFVHVLDDTSLHLLLSTFDTVSDFIEYLTKKESLICSGNLGMATGEEGLVGWYVGKLNKHGEHDFVLPDNASLPLNVDESRWHDFLKSPELASKLEADRVSYFWDHVIEQFARNFIQGTAHFLSDPSAATQDQILRFFARENRTRRRTLAAALVEMLQTTDRDKGRLRVLTPTRPGDPYWVLLLFPFRHDKSYQRNREVRQAYLSACCRVVKLTNPDAEDIIAFATESGRDGAGSEDAQYFDARSWTEKDAEQARADREKLQILIRPRESILREYEYPSAV